MTEIQRATCTEGEKVIAGSKKEMIGENYLISLSLTIRGFFFQSESVFYTFSEPPSPPRDPQIVDFDNQSVTLRWSPPADNGGRPITHYIIQKKDKFGGWFDALVTDDKTCVAK